MFGSDPTSDDAGTGYSPPLALTDGGSPAGSVDGADDPHTTRESNPSDRSDSADQTRPDTAETANAELERQQRIVGIGGAVFAGIALAIGVVQRFPDAPVITPIVAGLVGATVVFWLVRPGAFTDGQDESN